MYHGSMVAHYKISVFGHYPGSLLNLNRKEKKNNNKKAKTKTNAVSDSSAGRALK